MLYLVTDAANPASWIYVAKMVEDYQTLPRGPYRRADRLRRLS